jgi:hypothetical protein
VKVTGERVGEKRRVTPEAEREILIGRMLTAFGRYPLTAAEVREKAEWVVAGWPWWTDTDADRFYGGETDG